MPTRLALELKQRHRLAPAPFQIYTIHVLKLCSACEQEAGILPVIVWRCDGLDFAHGRPLMDSKLPLYDHHHAVQFYGDRDSLFSTVAGFLGQGFEQGHAAVIIAT